MPLISTAQFTVREYENRFSLKPYHFGITLGYNTTGFKITRTEDFLYNDSVYVVESVKGPGFNLGIISNLRLSDHFDLRFVPSLSFAEKDLNYTLFDEKKPVQIVESIYFDFPFDIKFKSDSYRDFKIYVIGGIKYAYDLQSNAKARNAEELVKIGSHDVAVNYGFGFEFYFPYFIFCPEIKLSNGLIDLHSPDPNLIYSRVIDKLYSRSIVFTIHLEG
ncbi:MAG: outer membrane beta-barrel protein [Chitinophagales bacterium]|nr:outer membrane beta-barrel protein [Chitinophagales bacterium]